MSTRGPGGETESAYVHDDDTESGKDYYKHKY